MISSASQRPLRSYAGKEKLFLAAPCSGLPSALTALPAQASRLHFFTKLILAAP